MTPTLAGLLLSALVHAAHGQTLYDVSRAIPSFTEIEEGYTSLFAVGVGSDGWTTYTQSGTISLDVVMEPSTTRTLVAPSNPAELGGEFEANASGLRVSEFGGELAETCAFGADGRGTCVERQIEASSTLLDVTFSGSVVPFFTLVAVGAQSTLTTPPSSPTASSFSPASTSTSSTNGAAVTAFPLPVF
ncbi:hypothetical protein K438DRAFT_1168905 [Mycena galopus ATCC 62051]|nr:hypothetical protein K438DRAFT_1168905 [Mycena galopus ATCC 62051]